MRSFVVKIQRELSPEMRPKSFGTFEKQALHDLHLPRVPTYLTKLGVRLKTLTSSFYGGNFEPHQLTLCQMFVILSDEELMLETSASQSNLHLLWTRQ